MALQIVGVAIKLMYGVVLSLPSPYRHHNILKHYYDDVGVPVPHDSEQGFLLSNGEFAGREAALEIARYNGQLIPRTGNMYDGPELFSEDLW